MCWNLLLLMGGVTNIWQYFTVFLTVRMVSLYLTVLFFSYIPVYWGVSLAGTSAVGVWLKFPAGAVEGADFGFERSWCLGMCLQLRWWSNLRQCEDTYSSVYRDTFLHRLAKNGRRRQYGDTSISSNGHKWTQMDSWFSHKIDGVLYETNWLINIFFVF